MAGRHLRVGVVVLRESTAIVPVGVAELLKKTVQLGAIVPGVKLARKAEILLVGETLRVRTAGGWPVQCDTTFARLRTCDLVVVPALDPDVLERLELNRAAVRFVRDMARAGADVASACTGAFVLAEAGLLDGRRATTHWAFQSLLTERHPSLRLEPQAILVDQGRVCTAGGATSFINLTHYIIERYLGRDVAVVASKTFLIDPNKSPQGAYAMFSSQRDHGDDDILRAQEMIERDVSRAVSVAELARAIAMSQRTFVRRFKLATGNTPLQYIQRVRVEHAKKVLEVSRAPLDSVATKVGYRDPVAFRKLFTRLTGLTPADYRRRYGPRSRPGMVATKGRVSGSRAGRSAV